MTFLSPRNWLKPLQRQSKVCRRFPPRTSRAPRPSRPRLEQLEDRVTPTVFTPTVFNDVSGTGSGSLRQAVIDANNDPGTATDTIQLSAGTYTLSRVNDGNNHEVNTPLTPSSSRAPRTPTAIPPPSSNRRLPIESSRSSISPMARPPVPRSRSRTSSSRAATLKTTAAKGRWPADPMRWAGAFSMAAAITISVRLKEETSRSATWCWRTIKPLPVTAGPASAAASIRLTVRCPSTTASSRATPPSTAEETTPPAAA
jgi:hypothetical protein